MGTVKLLSYPVYSMATDGRYLVTSGGGGGKEYGIKDCVEFHKVTCAGRRTDMSLAASSNDKLGILDTVQHIPMHDLWMGACGQSTVFFTTCQTRGVRIYGRVIVARSKDEPQQTAARFCAGVDMFVTGNSDGTVRIWGLTDSFLEKVAEMEDDPDSNKHPPLGYTDDLVLTYDVTPGDAEYGMSPMNSDSPESRPSAMPDDSTSGFALSTPGELTGLNESNPSTGIVGDSAVDHDLVCSSLESAAPMEGAASASADISRSDTSSGDVSSITGESSIVLDSNSVGGENEENNPSEADERRPTEESGIADGRPLLSEGGSAGRPSTSSEGTPSRTDQTDFYTDSDTPHRHCDSPHPSNVALKLVEYKCHDNEITDCDIAHDGKMALSISREQMVFYQLSPPKFLCKRRSSMRFKFGRFVNSNCRDGHYQMLTVEWEPRKPTDCVVSMWRYNAESGNLMLVKSASVGRAACSCMSLGVDDRHFALGFGTGAVGVYTTRSLQCVMLEQRHQLPVTDVVFLEDKLASSGADFYVIIKSFKRWPLAVVLMALVPILAYIVHILRQRIF
ncbi:WD 40 repeat domain containing protein,putative [Babesia bigemina]|uniref:WD 40 repeat domain containing protein,putative n=1 Tax=Babesia bigemina TaxID=5866 RepID=A0A061DAW3_BABBI|nr:WD 40 repeat domain containing protein,putative [Babesia bigemina]CDR96064.1 WD 40 repeat domain containing protein,putative [Babesia bigemina]|eukprot:XP_012768250.1 WD 40 repeat domain containing protein,putative [Babesia bigemina]